MNCKIRRATHLDVEFISEIELTCWGSNGATREDFATFFQEKIGTETILLAHEDDLIFGFIGISLNEKSRSIYIWNLAVSPEHRRQGIAQALLERVLAEANQLKVTAISLIASELNESAIGLYKKLDFQENSRKPNYYADGSCGIELVLRK